MLVAMVNNVYVSASLIPRSDVVGLFYCLPIRKSNLPFVISYNANRDWFYRGMRVFTIVHGLAFVLSSVLGGHECDFVVPFGWIIR